MKTRKLVLSVVMLVLVATGILTSCSKVERRAGVQTQAIDSGIFARLGLSQAARADMITVTDLIGQPIAQAQVLIGHQKDEPFVSNFFTTDNLGQAKIPAGWSTPQVVTISAKGFVRASYFGQTPQGQTFQLRPAQTKSHYELKGNGTGFHVVNGDNKIDFALMVPILKKPDLFAFDIGMFISPESDTISTAGQSIDVPSNISLPKQTENYGFFPVTLEKPIYRMFFQTTGKHKVFTARGQFPFKEVVGQLQNKKTFLDVINSFTLQGGSIREVDITSANQNMDLPVDELAFNQTRTLQAPKFANDELLLAIPLSAYQGELLPTDLKNIPSNASMDLSIAAGEAPQVLVVLKKKSEPGAAGIGKLTAAMMPFSNHLQPALLPMIESPQVIDASEVKIQVPAGTSGIFAAGSVSVLSTIENKKFGSMNVEIATRVWEVYSKEWMPGFQLPVWPGESAPVGKKRWEISLLGRLSNKAVDLSPRILETMTHATHSATDFE